MQAREALKQYFGYDVFRPGQGEVVDAVMAGRDVFAVMPTGAGKSICYQVPALCLDGYTLVISPLISLMQDQVSGLQQAGVKAECINSSKDVDWRRLTMIQAAQGDLDLLYVSPERLGTDDFAQFAIKHPPARIAVDEAHCISQWGQDFRPSYTRISEFIARLPQRPPVCAFTATATSEVRSDVLSELELIDPFVTVSSFDRPNLHFEVRRPADKDDELLKICKAHKGKSGIIYCLTRKATEEICSILHDAGISALPYHAGLSDETRRKNQDAFVYDRVPVVVATNAFGMGIDKSDVSFVVHYNMPLDVESYYQEAGRAGRDGEPADCILLYVARDVRTCEFLLSKSAGEGESIDPQIRNLLQERAAERLRKMTFYSTTNECLRKFLLSYFGEEAPGFCGYCSNCETEFEDLDALEEARKIISCVYRLRERDLTLGKTMIVDILRGAKTERLLRMRLDTLSTYGIMADVSMPRARFILDTLIERGWLQVLGDRYPVIAFSDESMRFLREEKSFVLKVPKDKKPAARKEKRKRRRAAELTGDVDEALFEKLRELRATIAREEDVPAYIVFTNAALADMAVRKPTNETELLEVSGVGTVKAERYGTRFLAAIAEYKQESM